jgi:hypothetical protein
MKATRELTDTLDRLNTKEKAQLRRAVIDLAGDAPRTPVAVAQFKLLVGKAGKEAPGAFKELLVGVVSNVILKQLGLG